MPCVWSSERIASRGLSAIHRTRRSLPNASPVTEMPTSNGLRAFVTAPDSQWRMVLPVPTWVKKTDQTPARASACATRPK